MLTYENCTLCPRKCGVDREKGERGFCRMPGRLRLARCAPYFWEEPVLAAKGGAGAVFFSGCTLRCGYCQNSELSHDGLGREVSSGELRKMLEDLVQKGVQCIDLVTPTHFLPDILPALEPKLPVPVVYNCGGYESVETLRALEGNIDIYLPDLKYSDKALAAELSGAGDYVETAKAAILEMYRQTGPVVVEDGRMKRGVLLRHLVLPGYLQNTLGVLDWVGETFRPGEILVSLMGQYTPMGRLNDTPPLDRAVTEEEYAAAQSWMALCGISGGFTQERTAADEKYVPDWDLI